MRTLLAHAARHHRRAYGLDVKSAFLLASIPSNIIKRYAMRPPRLLIDLGLCTEDELWMVDKALYGFRESPKWWSVHRDDFLTGATWTTSLGNVCLQQLTSEGNVWSMRLQDGSCIGHLLVYVDDMLLLTEPEVAHSFIDWLRKTWECTGLKEATALEPLRFLGVDIYAELDKEDKVVGYSLAQEFYISELLRTHSVQPNPKTSAPVPKEWVREVPQQEDFAEHELREAQRITGELLWISQRTRVDISYSVGMMSSWVAKYPRQVSKIGHRILEYLANTRCDRLMLIPRKRSGLQIFTDASFAPYGAHSISGIVLQYDGCCLVWKSKRQSLVTLSTAESELVSGCEGVVLAQSLEALLSELEGSSVSKHLRVDNTAALVLAEGGGSQRTRHLRVRSAFIRDMLEKQEIQVSHCPGDIQLADCLTKALMRTRLSELCKLLGLGPPNPPKKPAQISVVSHLVPTPQDIQGCTPPEASPHRFGGRGRMGTATQDRVGLWLIAVLMLLQADLNEASSEEELPGEPLSLELSLIVCLMVLSVLFLWESARHCIRSCCLRRVEEPMIRMIHARDDDDGQLRRERRQETVRRAIERELHGEGLRQRSSQVQEGQSTGSGQPYVRVQVEASQGSAAVDFLPPPPPYPVEEAASTQYSPDTGLRNIPVPPTDGLRNLPVPPTDGLRGSTATPGSIRLPSFPSGSQPSVPTGGPESISPAMRDESTQTNFDRGLEFQQMCELHVITTSSRTPGALHLFRNCHALRSTTVVQERMFCRYCLQAFREG